MVEGHDMENLFRQSITNSWHKLYF